VLAPTLVGVLSLSAKLTVVALEWEGAETISRSGQGMADIRLIGLECLFRKAGMTGSPPTLVPFATLSQIVYI
jgi:hypothetical protein